MYAYLHMLPILRLNSVFSSAGTGSLRGHCVGTSIQTCLTFIYAVFTMLVR